MRFVHSNQFTTPGSIMSIQGRFLVFRDDGGKAVIQPEEREILVFDTEESSSYLESLAEASIKAFVAAETAMEAAERECPWKPGDIIRLKNPYRKKDVGVVKRVEGGWFDADLSLTGPWLVKVVMFKNDGSESSFFCHVGPDGVAGRAERPQVEPSC